ncbi:hypothetical protein Taro_017421 [Colocasia esculenta]|uniref:Aminotransferase-like plant mobile domain-containing protein n=1 Tax=Colocasia esculenta TaxID=4460 RepID=A0A843UVZ3_COLES|nr:hypothetical protein [Colocasia esculenta]
MGKEVPYEGPKRARTSYGDLLRLTDVPNHLSNNGDVREATVLLEEVEAFMALPKTKRGDEQQICYTVEPINPKLIQVGNISLQEQVWESPGEAKAVAICLCGVVLFPSGDHLIDYVGLSAISGEWRGLSLSHAVLAYLFAGLTSASTRGPLYGSMILLECWLGVRIKFKPVENPTTESRIFGCHPLCFIGGAAKFPDRVICRTADNKTRSAWRHYFNTLPIEHFALGIAALREVEIRLPLGRGLDLQLVGNMAMVLYNPQRCYLKIGKPRTKLLQPSHLPPMKKRRLGDLEDEQAVRSALSIWRACATHTLPPTLHEERETCQAYLQEYEGIRPCGDHGAPSSDDLRLATLFSSLSLPLPSFNLPPPSSTIPRWLLMEGGDQGGDGGEGRRKRGSKRGIHRRQTDEGPYTAAPATPMEADPMEALGEEEDIGPKKVVYQGLPDFQRTRLEEMGFGPFLRLDELTPDVVLIQALKERWDPECHAFLLPWGQMIPTLEDVEIVKRLLGLEVTRERSSLVARTRLQASLGVEDARHQTGEGQVEYMAQLTEDARAALVEEEGAAADRDLRRFLILVIGKLILGTRGDPVSCRCLPLLEDLTQVGSYAWGAALLAHLFDSLGTSGRETGVAGFFPLLQCQGDQALRHYCSIGGSAAMSGHCAFRFPCGVQVEWTPYAGEDDTDQSWVEQGRPYFGREIWLHAFNTVVPLHLRLVARTLGLHQAAVEFLTQQRPWERPGRSFRGLQQVTDWRQRGRVVISEATSDEDYFCAYARKYGAQLDLEGRIASLEGVLHSTIQ